MPGEWTFAMDSIHYGVGETRMKSQSCRDGDRLPKNLFPRTSQPPTHTSLLVELLVKFASKVVLEVCGSGGAIWGFSEICLLRTTEPESIRFWRSVSLMVATVFGVRLLRQVFRDFSELRHPKHIRDGSYRELLHGNRMIPIQKYTRSSSAATAATTTTDLSFSDHSSVGFQSGERQPTSIAVQLSSMLLGDLANDHDTRDDSLFLEDSDDSDDDFGKAPPPNELTTLTASPVQSLMTLP